MSTLVSHFPLMILVLPLLGALLIALRPADRAHRTALAFSFAVLLVAFGMIQRFDWSAGATYQFAHAYPVIPQMGISLSWGLDAVAMWLVILTALLQDRKSVV